MLEKIKLTLRKAESKDINLLCHWTDDSELAGNVFGKSGMNYELRQKYFAAIIEKGQYEPPSTLLMIAEGEQPNGFAYLTSIDWKNRSLFVSIALRPELRNSLFGVNLLFETLKFCFDNLNMHKVCGHIHEDNQKMENILKNFGATMEGLLGSFVIKGGKVMGVHRYSFFQKDLPALKDIISKNY